MGRMLEAMKRVASQGGLAAGDASESAGDQAAVQTVAAPADEEIPYIEVGGRDKAVDASPSVLVAPVPKMLGGKPAHLPPPRSPILADAAQRGVTFVPADSSSQGNGKIASEVIAYYNPAHPVSEQYCALLARIRASLSKGDSSVLLFMALTRGAGTTTTLLNLGVTWCKHAPQPVVAVDANLARPALAKRLGVVTAVGLDDVLRGKQALEQALIETAVSNLHVLAASAPDEPGQLLRDENVRWLMARLRERFPVVLVDGPVWDENGGSAALASSADAVYLVLDAHEGNSPAVRQVTRSLAQRGCRLGGLILGQ
jgi:Mrp family chromosome partitioning ATPase